MMPRLTGKHAFLELLRQEGVAFIFGNPGTTELSLMDALAVEDLPRYVLALHESVALTMAHGYALASGRLAAVNLHAAPGLGNALGMLYNAKKAGVPLLVTAGQHDTRICLSEPLLWDDLAVMAAPYVKWSVQVQSLADLPRALHRACKVALTAPAGPVFLSIPDDVLTAEAELDLLAPTRIGAGMRADAGAVATAAAAIASARAPMIFAGDAVTRSFAQDEVAALAELIGAPVFCEAMADTASFPASHRLFAGLIPRVGPAARAAIEPYDLIVSLGGDLFTLSLPSGVEPIAPGARIVHLDNDAWEIGKNYPAEAALLGDPKATLPELIDAVAARLSTADRAAAAARAVALEDRHRQRRASVAAKARAQQAASPIQPMALLQAIGEALPKNAAVVEELLSSNPGLRDLILSDDPQSYYGMRGGGIGMALPQAVGVKLALPNRPVVALVGDGSALYTIQALWSAAHERLAIVFVVFNNRSYRILKQRVKAIGGHTAETGRYVAMDLTDPPIDYLALATGFGVRAVRVETLAAFRAAFAEGLSGEGPVVIDVAVDAAV